MASHPRTVPIDAFKGLNNILRPENTPTQYLKKAENINIDNAGKIHKRKGYTKVINGNWTSLWASENGNGCYGVLDGNLVQVNTDYSTTLLRSNVGSYKLDFEEIDDKVYYISPLVKGVIQYGTNRSWGVTSNTLAPTLTAGTGTLHEGTYQVSFTYVSSSGLEGGTSISSSITVGNGSSISFAIPAISDPEIIGVRIYCSTANGIELYYHGFSLGGLTYTISSISSSINILRFFNLAEPPLGQSVNFYKGRLFIAQDNVLWYSEPYQYEHFNLAKSFIEYPERIKEVMPVEDGIWIGSDKLYYITGSKPDEFRSDAKEHIKIVEGTAQKISGSYLFMENTPIGYKYLATFDIGIFVLFNNGLVINLTSKQVSLERADSGSSIFLQDEGMNQYLSILKTNENPNNSVIGDFVEATIVRNGVIIT